MPPSEDWLEPIFDELFDFNFTINSGDGPDIAQARAAILAELDKAVGKDEREFTPFSTSDMENGQSARNALRHEIRARLGIAEQEASHNENKAI